MSHYFNHLCNDAVVKIVAEMQTALLTHITVQAWNHYQHQDLLSIAYFQTLLITGGQIIFEVMQANTIDQINES